MSGSILEWDEYFMSLALITAKRSKDPVTQVGAVICDKDHKVLSMGYNGFPKTLGRSNDETYSWKKPDKYLYVVHAEENCILNGSTKDYKNCTMYSTLFPCNKCTQSIIQVGISKVVFYTHKNLDTLEYQASLEMLSNAGVAIQKYNRKEKYINIEVWKT